MVAAIVELLRSPCLHPAEAVEHYLVPTYDLRALGFDPRRYWRGPVWINTDWLLWLGLRQHGVDDLAPSSAPACSRWSAGPGSASTSTPSAARATAEYMFACRLYRHEHHLAGQPEERWLRTALLRLAVRAERPQARVVSC